VPLESQQGIVAQHAAAIAGDADEAPAAAIDFHAQVGRTGIERILKQFFDHGLQPTAALNKPDG
jgi:hypothetical protein